MNTIEEQAPAGRRRRRRYSREFKAQVVAACQGPGVSIAAIALHHQLNANLLRRWVEQTEGETLEQDSSDAVVVRPAAPPAFVSVPLETRTARPTEIRIEVRRADQSITVSWPTTEAAQCAAWLREWLR
ncbi:putative transposase [Burkholderia lata]|uniref:Putative transposase n=1 Tax=Burkholderia lata (strain ATCC 17760 / DSM 23089 / LMG 22485 / NCIMB 9086 / R18194 / 383) TaxID=482957 RepID=A0A6P2NQ67_BURL3|nr:MULTISPECIES: transposase [Burkholderia]VWB96844.1 putative transposase [Burkholderia lata]